MLELTLNGTTRRVPEVDLDDAMKEFWLAKQAGDTSAALVKVELPLPEEASDGPTRTPVLMEVPAPHEAVKPAPGPTPAPTAPGTLSVVAQRRIAEQGRVLTEAGFALPPPLYAPGTRVLPTGDENFRIARREVALLPEFGDAASALILRVASEEREDVRVRIADLIVTDDGRLSARDDLMYLEEDAFVQLANLAGFGCGARYLTECCPPPLRATNVNEQVAKNGKREIVLRTRNARNGGRSVYACVSPSYAAVDAAWAIETVVPALRDARAELVYDGRSTTATALWMPDEIVDLGAGDLFKIGVRISCDDTGRGRIRISAVAWRNLCLNLVVIAEGEAEVASLVHRGEPENIVARLPAFVEQARTKVSSFLTAWGHARTLKVDVPVLLRKWVEEKQLVVTGAGDREEVVKALLTAYAREPGDSYADAINAVTRASHEATSWPLTARFDLERQAGRLLEMAA